MQLNKIQCTKKRGDERMKEKKSTNNKLIQAVKQIDKRVKKLEEK